MSSNFTLFYASASPPARACLLVARYLELDIEVKHVNISGGEHHSEEFKKVNPDAKVPFLVDGDLGLGESRAIMAYLVNSRKPGNDLYPSEPKARALVDQRLYYDATNVFVKLGAFLVSLIFNLFNLV